jgi:thiol:disulfide interchange protein DsbD
MRPRIPAFAWLLPLVGLLAHAQDWAAKRPAHVSVAPVQAVTVTPARPAVATVRLRVAPGFHINSSRPSSDLLIPTVLTVSAVPQVRVGKVAYPPGRDFTLSIAPGEKLNVYTGEVALTVPLTAARPPAPGAYTLKAELRYQACDDSSCYPPRTIAFEIPVTVVAARR